MNITQLRLFRDIAREMSFVKAAEQNHISQPAVSVHIKKLEHELGKQLFVRTPHNIQLTAEGQTVLADVKEILRLCDGLKIRSSYNQGILEGNIRIATIYSIGMYELGDFLSSFMRAFPKVHIHLQYQNSHDIYKNLIQEKIDLGLVAFAEQRTQIEALPWGHDELVLITSASHPLSSKTSVKLEQINNESFIAFDQGIPTREATDQLLKKHKVNVDIRMTNDNIYTLKKAVEAGVGISIVPSSTVEEEVSRSTISRVKINKANTRRPLALLKLKHCKPNTPLEIFTEKLLEFANQK